MKKISLLLLLTLCIGCALFKRTTTTTNQARYDADQQTNLKTAAETERTKNAKYLKFEKDTTNAAYRIQFWPKGRLIFSSREGFEGEFDSILMTGYLQKSASSTVKSDVKEQQKERAEANLNHNSALNMTSKTKVKQSFPDYFWIAGGLILTGIIIFKVFRR